MELEYTIYKQEKLELENGMKAKESNGLKI